MRAAAGSLTYPFRPGALRAWIPALLLVLVLPLGLVPLLGYTVRAVRSSAAEPEAAPPSWRPDARLLKDGVLVLSALVALAAPFALAAPVAYSALTSSHLFDSAGDPFYVAAYGGLATAALLWLPFLFLLLLLVPPNIAAYAMSGRAVDLFNPLAATRAVARSAAAWNAVTVVVVTGWTIALVGAGLLCVGFIPAAVYAMLVSAHAFAILCPRTPGTR